MRDISDQLREWSNSLAESVDPVELDRTRSLQATSTEPATKPRWLAIAASIVLVVGGVVAIGLPRNRDSDDITPATTPSNPTDVPETTPETTPETSATPSPTTTDAVVAPPQQSTTSTTDASTTSTATPQPADRLSSWPAPSDQLIQVDDIPALLPGAQLPSAGLPVRAQTEGGSAAQPTFTQVFADAGRSILLTLQTTPNSVETTPDQMRQPTTIEGWDDAFFTDGSLRLVASDPSGYVRLTGTGLDDEQAAALIASMQRRPDGSPGWNLPAESGLVEINGAWNDSAGQRVVTWFDGTRVIAQMLISPSHTDLIAEALGPDFDPLEQVDVNGHVGWMNATPGRRSVVWSPDGTNIVVLGIADDRLDPLTVASSVTTVDIADYEARTTTEVPAGLGDGCSGSLFC